MPQAVAAAFGALPDGDREVLLAVREQVFAAAGEAGAGPLTETLKWGEPAYLTDASRSGSTLRLGLAGPSRRPALLVNCRTGLAGEVRDRYGDLFGYEGTRGILLPRDVARHAAAIRHCAALALTYHARRRGR
jgi:hypothetical protein